MKELKPGDQCPEFCLPDHSNKEICIRDLKGKWVVLYFYPKDNTSGCTLEAVTFSKMIEQFEELNAIVIGISPDSIKSHEGFINKYDLKVKLLSEPEHTILKEYGVWQKKKLYDKEYFGVVRSTFLISPDGKIASIWRKVKVNGHVQEVKKTLDDKNLTNNSAMRFSERLLKDPLLKKIFESLPAWLVITDRDRTVFAVNRSLKDFLGKEDGDIINLRIGEGINCIHSKEIQEGCGYSESCIDCILKSIIAESIEINKPIHNLESSITIFRNDREEKIDILVSCIPFEFEKGLYSILAITNITQLKDFERQKIADLEIFSKIGTDAASIVHDIRNPLTGIMGYINLMRISKDEEERENFRNRIEILSLEIKKMADEILTLATEEVITDIVVKGANIDTIVQDILNELKIKIPVKLQLKCHSIIYIPEEKLRQVIWNILKNAEEALKDQKDAKIVVKCECDQNFFLLIIEDNGPGIVPEIASRLFQPGKTHGKKEGKGLGLYSAKRILEIYHGELWFDTIPGKGTTFYIKIPLKKEEKMTEK